MFIGHFGAGFAGKKFAKRPSLGTLFIAAQFIDLLFPILLILGLESVKIEPGNTVVTPFNFINYPISHSLLGVLLWSLLVGGIYYYFKKDKHSSVVLGLLVLSHWVLDLISHRPDLPVIPGVDWFVGFGLWNSLPATIIIEGAIFGLGIYYYLASTTAKNKTGLYAFWGLIVFLVVAYFSSLFGPVPSSEEPFGYVGLSQWLLVAWGYWIDKNRENK